MLGTFLLSLRGTIYIYQGQEMGMPHPDDWKLEDYKDVETQRYYKASVSQCRMCVRPRMLIFHLTQDVRATEEGERRPRAGHVGRHVCHL
jgi:glycosidase